MSDSYEQRARDLLERLGYAEAQQMTSGDVIELANMFHEIAALKQQLATANETVKDWREWARFVFQGNQPPTLEDDKALQAVACAQYALLLVTSPFGATPVSEPAKLSHKQDMTTT